MRAQDAPCPIDNSRPAAHPNLQHARPLATAMPAAPDNPQFDNLVKVIETLQKRIRSDGATIRGNELRTRTALIDPLLYALGWDAANPALVLPEYRAAGGSADYALLKMERNVKPPVIAFIEAKRLGEPLKAHTTQMLTYANAEGVRYAGLTDGDRWELYEIFKEAPIGDRRILSVSIRRESPFDCAVKLQPLVWPRLETGAAFSPEGADGLLRIAISSHSTPMISLLAERGANLNARDENGWTPLHLAASIGAPPDVLLRLIDGGADIQADPSPLHVAADEATVRFLLGQGVSVNARNAWGATHLHRAAGINENSEVIATLLDCGADIDARDKYDQTPLHLAARRNPNPWVSALLIDRGADPNRTTFHPHSFSNSDSFVFWDNPLTPFHQATRNNVAVVEAFIERGANIESRSHNGWTPLHTAVRIGKRGVVEFLIRQGANVHARDDLGWTALHHAALHDRGGGKITQALLDAGSEVEAVDKGKFFNEAAGTPARLAARVGDPRSLEALLAHGANIHQLYRGRRPLIHDAMLNDRWHGAPLWLRSICLLLDRGIDIETRSESLAVFPDPDYAHLVMDWEIGSDVGWTPLHQAAGFEGIQPDAAALLLDRGADIEARGGSGMTPLHLAAQRRRNGPVVQLLIERGANVNARDDQGRTPLHFAVDRNADWLTTIEALLNNGADLQAHARDEKPMMPRKCELPLPGGAEVDVSLHGATPLHWAAAKANDPDVVKMLLDYGASIYRPNAAGLTPLHCAVRDNANPAVTEALLDGGAYIHASAGGATPLFFAATCNTNLAVMRLLLDRGADVEGEPGRAQTPLQAVASQRHPLPGALELLLAHHASASIKNGLGMTALHLAAESGAEPAVIEVLLDRNISIEETDYDGRTPLHVAAAHNDEPAIVRTLLENGADRDAQTNDGKTPYDLAVERGASAEILNLL